jgi:hypothetical protein
MDGIDCCALRVEETENPGSPSEHDWSEEDDNEQIDDDDRPLSRLKRQREEVPLKENKKPLTGTEQDASLNPLYVGVVNFYSTIPTCFKRLLAKQRANRVRALIIACYEAHPTMCDYEGIAGSIVFLDIKTLLEECFEDVEGCAKIHDDIMELTECEFW